VICQLWGKDAVIIGWLSRIAQRALRLSERLLMPASYALAKKEKTMPQSQHAQAAELHNHAAHAHAVAACQHSTGDHINDQSLTRMAYERSQKAAQLSKEIAKHEPDSMDL
jgi:hypothetical protein